MSTVGSSILVALFSSTLSLKLSPREAFIKQKVRYSIYSFERFLSETFYYPAVEEYFE
jgi:hypothetical protein